MKRMISIGILSTLNKFNNAVYSSADASLQELAKKPPLFI